MTNQNRGTYFFMFMVLSNIFDFFFLYFGYSVPSDYLAFFLIRKVELRLLLKRMLLYSVRLLSEMLSSILFILMFVFWFLYYGYNSISLAFRAFDEDIGMILPCSVKIRVLKITFRLTYRYRLRSMRLCLFRGSCGTFGLCIIFNNKHNKISNYLLKILMIEIERKLYRE